ncbi:hypothetical protein GCM10025867_36100 [Frondihabitans sucicola]|uniref:Asp23/Gls24 family envelope stress response protein n=1 Tax=Frondihabitans sucicola TaxID=1268041 RepID=A0ABN6Y2T1_9MICO|nr:hypothetical protein GCM10025867_36100 [Frondihabitans sucicola]
MTDDRELSRRLTTLVREIPGVVEIYSTVPLIASAVQGVVSLFTDREEALVGIGHDGALTTVSIHIALQEDRPGPETLRAVTTAIREHLSELGLEASIELKVVRFADKHGTSTAPESPTAGSDGPLAEVG